MIDDFLISMDFNLKPTSRLAPLELKALQELFAAYQGDISQVAAKLHVAPDVLHVVISHYPREFIEYI